VAAANKYSFVEVILFRERMLGVSSPKEFDVSLIHPFGPTLENLLEDVQAHRT
jgi:hypothetical protein